FDADFADVFEVKRSVEAAATTPGSGAPAQAAAFGKSVLALSREGRGWSRRTEVRFSPRPRLENRTAHFAVELAAGGRFPVCEDIYTIALGAFVPPRRLCAEILPHEAVLEPSVPIEPVPAHPVLETDSPALAMAFEQSIRDMHALRIRHLEA